MVFLAVGRLGVPSLGWQRDKGLGRAASIAFGVSSRIVVHRHRP
jgi:hypothetical protein